MKSLIHDTEFECFPMFPAVTKREGPGKSAMFGYLVDRCIQNDWRYTVTQQEIANKLGIRRETVIRQIKYLHSAGYIEYTKRGGRGVKLTYSIPENLREDLAEALKDAKY